MATEKVVAQLVIETDKSSFTKAGSDLKVFARDTKKELDKNTLFQLKLDKANLQIQLNEARAMLVKAKKEGDKNSIINLQIKTDDLRSNLTEAGRQLNNYKNTGDVAISRLQAKFDGLKGSIGGVNKILGFLGVSLGTFFSAQKVQELSDSFTNLSNRLKLVAEENGLDQLREKIFEGANSARVGVEQYAATFSRFDLVNKQLGGSQEETLKIVDSLAKGLSATGAAGSEVSSVMLQVAQAFGSGRLAGDEFRSVSENMPILLDILAKKLGVARGELKDMAAEGLITSQVLKEALIESNEKLNDSFDKTSLTIGQTMTQATNDFIKKFGEMDEPYGITLKITTAITTLKDGFLAFVDVVGYSVNVIGKLLNTIPATVGTMLILVSEAFIGTFKSIGINTGILVDNIGVVFKNGLPNAVKIGANSALAVMELFINKVGKGITGLFSKIPGFGGLSNLSDISLGRLDTVGTGGIKSFESGFDFSLSTKSAIKAKGVYDDFTDSLTSFRKEKGAVDDLLRGSSETTETTKPTGLGTGSSSSRVNAEEEIQKELEALRKQEQEMEERRNDWKKEQIEDLKDKQEEFTSRFEDGMKEAEKSAESFAKELENVGKEIQSIDDKLVELDKTRAETLGDRNVDIGKEQLKIEERLAELRDIGASKTTLDIDTLRQIGTGFIGENKVEDLIEYIDLQKELTDLVSEQALIRENTTASELETAALSPTAKFLQEFEQKKLALEEERLLKIQETEDFQKQYEEQTAIYDNFVRAKELVEDKYKVKIESIEASITSTIYLESQKRIESLKQVELQAIATANALSLAGVSATSTQSTGTGNTTNNNIAPIINVNATINNNTDIQQLGNQLADVISLSSKGIK